MKIAQLISLTGILIFILSSMTLSSCGREKNGNREEGPEGSNGSNQRGAEITGQVTVPQGVEPFGVSIFAEGTSFMALTDSDGEFTIQGLRAGEYRIRAMRPDLESVLVETITITESDIQADQPFLRLNNVLMEAKDSNTTGAAQFAQKAFGGVRGRVALSDGNEADGVVITVEGTRFRTVTLPDGSYELIHLPPGEYALVFSKSGYESIIWPVDIEAGDETVVNDITLEAEVSQVAGSGRTIYGTVELLNGAGERLTDYSSVTVNLMGTDMFTTPAPDGSYQMRSVPPGNYRVSASAPGFVLERQVDVNLSAVPTAEVNLRLSEDLRDMSDLGSLFGRVFLEDNPSSFAGISVALGGTQSVTYTDSDGNYEILNVEEGTYELVASFNGYKTVNIDGIRVAAGEISEVEDVLLELDVERPRVLSTSPADGETDVSIRSPMIVTIRFSQEMDMRSVVDFLEVRPEVSYRADYSPYGNTLRLELDAVSAENVLKYNTRYTVTIGESAANSKGVEMGEDFDFRFTTGKAKIIDTRPRDGDERVPFYPDEPLVVYFNAPVDPDSMSNDDIDFRPDLTGKPTIYFRTDSDTGWSRLHIEGIAEPDTEYRVRIKRNARTLTGDFISNVPYTFKFKTRERKTWDELRGYNYDEKDLRERERRR